jgi:hypothetical protein
VTPRRPWLALWSFWLAVAVALEVVALRDDKRGDTLSEFVAWVVYRAPRVLIPAGLAALAWFGWHIAVDRGLT